MGNKTSGTRSDISVNDSIDFWVEYNNSNPISEIEESGNIIIETYKEGDMGTEVVLCTLIYGEHWWPGSEKDPYKEISASELIWEFFKTHPKQ